MVPLDVLLGLFINVCHRLYNADVEDAIHFGRKSITQTIFCCFACDFTLDCFISHPSLSCPLPELDLSEDLSDEESEDNEVGFLGERRDGNPTYEHFLKSAHS